MKVTRPTAPGDVLIRFVRALFAVGTILIACGAACPVAPAAAPELVREWTNSFDEIVWDGSVLWLCDRNDAFPSEVIGLTGLTADGQEVNRTLPARAFRVGAATNGTLYATAFGPETDSNPSVWLLSYENNIGWQSIAQIFDIDFQIAVGGATIVPFGASVFIDLKVHWCFWYDGWHIGPAPDPDLVVLDTGTGLVSMSVPRCDGIFATAERAYCYSDRTDAMGYCDLLASSDGSTWAPSPRTMRPLDEYQVYVPFLPRGAEPPDATSGALGFGHGGSKVHVQNWAADFSMTRPIPLAEHGYTPGALSSPPDIVYNPVVSKGLAVARGGECAAVLLEFPSTDLSANPSFQLVAWSNDYLQNFEFHQLNDLGHLDAIATPIAIFLLRRTSSGSRLLRIPLPAEQVPIGNARHISLNMGSQEIPTGRLVRDPVSGQIVTQMVTVAFMDLGIEGAGAGPVQIETSTDLKNWFKLGLPMNTDSILRTVMYDRARFFR